MSVDAATDDPIWEVTMVREQEQKVYVQCATREEAKEAAENLAEPDEWDEIDTDYSFLAVDNPPRAYWSGGPKGGMVDV